MTSVEIQGNAVAHRWRFEAVGAERELLGARSIMVVGGDGTRRADQIGVLKGLDLELTVLEAANAPEGRETLTGKPVDAVIIEVEEVGGDQGAVVLLRGLFSGKASRHAKRVPVCAVASPPSRQDVVAIVRAAAAAGIENFKLLIRPVAPEVVCAYLVDSIGQSDRASNDAGGAVPAPNVESYDWVIERLKKGSLPLPGAPSTVVKIREMVRAGETSSDILGRAVEQDIAVMTMVLRLAGSVAYRGVKKIGSAREAIMRIGALQVGRLAEVALARSAFFSKKTNVGSEMQSAWQHTIARAELMRSTARLEGEEMQERRYLQGVLADVGTPLLVNAIAQVRRDFVIDAKSLKFLRESHEEVGGILLASWGVPNECVELARRHHTAELTDPTAKGLDLACRVATFLGYPSPFEEHEPLDPTDPESGLQIESEEDVAKLKSDIEEQLGATSG